MRPAGVLRFASLFSGCGGFDLGFIRAGFRCAGAFDIDPLAVEVHSRNLKTPVYVKDLSSGLDSSEALSNLDVLLAGSPCQGFSTAGKRELNDPRNQLLSVAGRIAVRLKPKVIILENVSGVLAGGHRIYWDDLNELIRSHGYRTVQLRCDATEMGVPQIRRRMVLLGWNTSWVGEVGLAVVPGGVLRNALSDLNEDDSHLVRHLPVTSRCFRIGRHLAPGQKLSNVRSGPRAVHTWHIPEVFGATTEAERRLLEAILTLRRRERTRNFGDADPVSAKRLVAFLKHPVAGALGVLIEKGYVRRRGGAYDLSRTFNGKYRRLSWDSPSPTVDTRFGDPHYFMHPDEDRGFTVREAARIQGFPDTFSFAGPERSQFRLVGNAVPPPMSQCIANWVRDFLL
jgi:DNA (cytosine-5)-methyltransferase 1